MKVGDQVAKRITLRILSVMLTLILVSLAVYSLSHFSLGDSASYILSEEASQEDLIAYREALGLDNGYWKGYVEYLKSFFTLEWGTSISGQSIRDVILSRLPLTLSLSLFSTALSVALFLSWAVISAIKGKQVAKAAEVFSVIAMSMPSFLVSILLVLLFSLLLKLFPVAGYIPASSSIIGYAKSMALPTLALAIMNSPLYLRIYSSELKRLMAEPYSQSIIAQGGDKKDVVLLSALKPSLLLGTSLIAESLASALAGSAIIETVFALPGFGSLMVSAALSRDVALSGTSILLITALVSFVYIASEIVQMLLDPRMRRNG